MLIGVDAKGVGLLLLFLFFADAVAAHYENRNRRKEFGFQIYRVRLANDTFRTFPKRKLTNQQSLKFKEKMFPNIKLSIPKRGSLNDLATSLKKNANDLHNMNPIVTSMKQKRENHALAMQLWEEHANPILKGTGIVDGDKNGVLERNMRLPGKVDSAHEEAEKKHSDFASMNKQEKMVYREEQKILRNKEKRIRKEEKENARAKRRAEKAHNKSTKKDRMNDKLLMKSEVAAEKELEAKMKKKNMSPKDIHIQKLLLHNERRVRMNEVLEDKFGKGKKIAFKNSSEVKRNKLIAVCAPIPGMLYGWTKGTENIKGVYKLGSEREGEKEQRARERKERLEFEAKKEEEMVINAQRKREEKKAKKIRMQGNNGKDPWEEKIAQKELMKGKKLVKKKKKRGEGGESKENEESEESEESGEEGLDREEDIEVEIDSEDDSDHDNNDGEIGIPRDAEEEARMIAEEFKRQARETRNRLKRMGYELSTKCCAACGSKTVGRPVDRWTGELKGGGANQWYIVGDQHFCYGCANNKTLMKGVAKVSNEFLN